MAVFFFFFPFSSDFTKSQQPRATSHWHEGSNHKKVDPHGYLVPESHPTDKEHRGSKVLVGEVVERYKTPVNTSYLCPNPIVMLLANIVN